MNLSRRGFLAMAAGLAALTLPPVKPPAFEPVVDQHLVAEEFPLDRLDAEADTVEVVERWGPDGWSVTRDGISAADIDWAQVEAGMEKVRLNAAHRRALVERLGEWVRIHAGLQEIGHVEAVDWREVVNAVSADDGPRATALVTPEQFTRLGKAVEGGGGFYVAQRGDWAWVLAVKGRPEPWGASEWAPHGANRLGVGLIPAGIRLRGWLDVSGNGRHLVAGGARWP